MQKFHSTVSRRDFMKFMGITAAGLGAAGLVAPVFHDLDEMAASTKGTQRRPWYVKEREFYNPTTEIDWSVMKRRDPSNTGQQTEMWAKYYGQARADAASAKGDIRRSRLCQGRVLCGVLAHADRIRQRRVRQRRCERGSMD